MQFYDRVDAGQRLAKALEEYRGPDTIVLGLPRGGVIVAKQVSEALGAQLDVILARKLGAPGNPEYAIGAIAEGGEPTMNKQVLAEYAIPQSYIADQAATERQEIERRVALYRQGRPLPDLTGKTVILVDDGIATGYTMAAAIQAIKSQKPKRLIVAVPVCARESRLDLAPRVDRLICLYTPTPFFAVGAFYSRFDQVTDDEVRSALGTPEL